MTTPRIRALALCVFHHEGKILVHRFYDPIKQQSVFRPVGGGIEFGETSAQAIASEVQVELVQSIHSVRLLGTLENIFTYLGNPGHEIVQVYDARFEDSSLYQRPHLDGQETDGTAFTVAWHDSSSFTHQSPLVPNGLYEMLKKEALLD